MQLAADLSPLALFRRHPKVGGAGVRNDAEKLLVRAEGDVDVLLGILKVVHGGRRSGGAGRQNLVFKGHGLTSGSLQLVHGHFVNGGGACGEGDHQGECCEGFHNDSRLMNFPYTFVFCPIAVKPRLELPRWIARGRQRQRQKAVASEERERRGLRARGFAEDDRMLHFMYGVRVLGCWGLWEAWSEGEWFCR